MVVFAQTGVAMPWCKFLCQPYVHVPVTTTNLAESEYQGSLFHFFPCGVRHVNTCCAAWCVARYFVGALFCFC